MYRLSFTVIFYLSGVIVLLAQSPHGSDFVMDCSKCHHPDNWTYIPEKSSFSHDSTSFSLTGRHASLDCRSCHQTLEFRKTESSCISCHEDVHRQSVGNDCARCHTTNSWIVENITELHENTGFPLIGVHAIVDCSSCHLSESNIWFPPTGMTCYDCHKSDFQSASNPDHVKNNFGMDCAACHDLNGSGWGTDKIDHSFFPLEQGHDINDCKACHRAELFSDISNTCFECHRQDFENARSPNHILSGFSNTCSECHTIAPGWNPVKYEAHDARHFPVYSGNHKDAWNACTDCHTNTEDFSVNSCIVCHINPETDEVHEGVAGYTYDNQLCLTCHPTGDAETAFNHNETLFPLTGAHKTTACLDRPISHVCLFGRDFLRGFSLPLHLLI